MTRTTTRKRPSTQTHPADPKTAPAAPAAPAPSGLRGRLGPGGPAAALVAAQAGTLVALGAVVYVAVFFCAVQVVPLTMGFVKNGTGVEMSDPVETVISFWIVPGLFLVGLIFAGLLSAIRALWRLRARSLAAVRAWAKGPTSPAADARTAGSTGDNKTTAA